MSRMSIDGNAGTTLNDQRAAEFRKSEDDERFLLEVNRLLHNRELPLYTDAAPEHPCLFVVGLPRSGTTLASQILAHGLEVGYVTNLAARFWLAPVHGLRLSRMVLGRRPPGSFQSLYAATPDPGDIHEFGYFWREWLRKRTFQEIVDSPQLEQHIDWRGLRNVVAAMQREAGSAMVFKNIHGGYHMRRLSEVLRAAVWLYVERDPCDVATSILDARTRYYGDRQAWWSYVPPEYPQLEKLPWDRQIAGQVSFLRRHYERQLSALPPQGTAVRVSFEELTGSPRDVVRAVADRVEAAFGHRLATTLERVPERFETRSHRSREAERRLFTDLLATYDASDAPGG
jgi:Sulfotransferase family